MLDNTCVRTNVERTQRALGKTYRPCEFKESDLVSSMDAQSRSEVRFAHLCVLIAEDDKFQRNFLKHVLRKLGIRNLLVACDGSEAMALMHQHGEQVDLIICDLDMPNVDGMTLIRHLAEQGTNTALAITSAYDASLLNAIESLCRARGILPLGMIEKPVTPAKLQPILEKVLQPKPMRQPRATASPEFTLPDIREGLRFGQFEPFFQPKVDLATGRITGAEALARWRHPELGIVPPSCFIPLLENGGEIDELTFEMLKSTAEALMKWRWLQPDFTMSVNLSLTSLRDTSLASSLVGILMDRGVHPRHVVLEVTESAAMTETAAALENLARLRICGFGLSIDDFGTGFASLEQLGRIAFTELKIDRGFVIGMGTQPAAKAIVESSIDIARRINIRTVAEGIETREQWDALRLAGCDFGQGYFFSQPVSAPEFAKQLNREFPL